MCIMHRRVQGIFPGGAKIQNKKFWRAQSARDFFRPPLRNFRPPSGGGEIFPEGGENPEESYKIGARRAPKKF